MLARRTRNNPVLVGETGKTAVLKGLAQRIAAGSVSELLRDRRLVGFDWAALIYGVINRRHFAERIKAVVQEVRSTGNVILLIDDIRILVGSPRLEFSRTASNHLKSALVRGEIQCIATATPDQYRQYLAGEPVLLSMALANGDRRARVPLGTRSTSCAACGVAMRITITC